MKEFECPPYGFFSRTTKWTNDTKRINPCLRISKYNSLGKRSWHRDAQYTAVDLRSNYTLLIYLNKCSSQTIFKSVNQEQIQQGKLEKVLFNGKTAEEELQALEDYKIQSQNICVTPQKGMAIIFDQRLLHCATPCQTDKWILRTDLVCSPTSPMNTFCFVW